MVAGAAVASADSPPGSDTKGTTSSESTKSTENKADSGTDDADKPKQKPSEDVTADPKDVDDTDATQGDEDKIADEPEPTAQNSDDGLKSDKDSDTAKKLADEQAKPVAPEPKPVAKPVVKQEIEDPKAAESTASTETTATLKTAESKTAAVAFAAPATADITSTAAAPPFSGLLSAIGTIVFNLYGLATRLFGGPPILPANSTVTVHSSTLRIDCGNGYEVPADWYIPDTAEPPTRLI
jgi:hypothetical protein